MSTDLSTARTLSERLLTLAAHDPDHILYRLLGNALEETGCLTAGELADRAQTVAAHLQAIIKPGDRVMLAFPTSLEFNVAYFGALLAGAIPVPAPTVSASSLRRRYFPGIMTTSQPSVLLSDDEGYAKWNEKFARIAPEGLERMRLSELESGDGPAWQPPVFTLDDPCVMLFSCHAGEPRGFAMTHRHLYAFARAVDDAFLPPEGLDELSFFGFLYPYFDFGFQTQTALPLLAGKGSCVFADSSHMDDPVLWLKAIDRYRIFASGALVESVERCQHAIEKQKLDGLDLSCWRAAVITNAYNQADLIDRFAETLEPYGFEKKSVFPVYATAEATSLITARRDQPIYNRFVVEERALFEGRVVPATTGAQTVSLIAQGRPVPETAIQVVNPSSCDILEEDEIGEIWVKGPGKLDGYWNNQAATAFTFEAKTTSTDETYVRTGDLGLMHNSELYVLEHWVHCLNYGSKQMTEEFLNNAAYGADSRLEEVDIVSFFINFNQRNLSALVIEKPDALPEKELPKIADKINARVMAEFNVPVSKLFFVINGAIPRNEAGNPDAYLCRRKFQPRCV